MYIGSLPAYQASGVRPRDEFTADGTQICFPLSQSVPGSFESGVTIVLDNVPQQPVEAFTVVDTRTLTFTAVTGTFTKNETVTGGTSSATGTVLKVNLGSIVVRGLTGTFANGETITGGSSSASGTSSVVSTNTGSGILFSEIPASGAFLYVVHEGNATYNLVPAAASVSATQLADNLRNFTVDTFSGDGSTTAFTLTDTPSSANAILVMVDGIVQTKTTNYTLATNVVTFTGAPDSGSAITVIHLGFTTVSRTGLVDGSITTAKLADGSITAAKIADGTIIAADVANGAITPAKLSTGGPAWDSSSNFGVGTASPSTYGLFSVYHTGTSGSATSATVYDYMASPAVGKNALLVKSRMDGSQLNYVAKFQSNDGSTEALAITTAGNVGVGTTSPVAKQHIKGTGISGQTTASLIVENASSGTLGLDITGTAGSSYARLRYGGGPSTGTNAMTGDAALIGLEGSSVGFQQIRFAATQVASSDANTLDDYEEGTWSPTYTSTSGSPTTSTSLGWYRKIGSLVYITVHIGGSRGTATGTLYISGLPFTGITATGTYGHGYTQIGDGQLWSGWTGDKPRNIFCDNNNNRLSLWDSGTGVILATDIDTSGNNNIVFSLCYISNS